MTEGKITVEELKLFVGSGLIINENHKLGGVCVDKDGCGWAAGYEKGVIFYFDLDEIKPLVRPLSQLSQEIEHGGEMFVPIDRIFPGLKRKMQEAKARDLSRQVKHGNVRLDYVLTLAGWHFDLFGWLDRGLAQEVKNV